MLESPLQTVRDAFELHRARLLSRAQVEERLRRALMRLRDKSTRHAAHDDLLRLLPHAPFHPDLLRGLLSQKKKPYDEEARRYWMALADAIGDHAEWQPPACGAWDEYEQRVLQRLAEGRHEKGTDSELYFEGVGPRIGRYRVELRWADEHHAAAKAAYDRFLSRGYRLFEDYTWPFMDSFRSPWRLTDIAGSFRRSALLQLFEDLAPLVEDVRFFCVTQMLRYEVWIVRGTCYVHDHPDDLDERVGDVLVPLLRSHPLDEALRRFMADHRRCEADRELEAIATRRTGASVESARRWIEDCRAVGGDVLDLSARLDELTRRA
ncbi:hypothetical protein [Nannocystis sp. SCPEA4]|uniref:hypothetical protein n=1 Tax=Nannocystis sp. SCPEA4 TaxID=2996787 RepID=UPI00226F30E8|nr:hypothetical protein [Nannocystis sp. SCPEA4]MCY1059003.1 hypothetical protein [Nannocystis sp. SCPEA4]